MTKLSEQNCVPCEKNSEIALTKEQALDLLPNLQDGWAISDDAKFLSREYIFRNFKQALEFVNKVGEIAEQQKHHPDIALGWGYVSLKIQTHNLNGLHNNDFVLAAKIDEV